MAQLEPTPENYARAYCEEAGLPPRQGAPSQGMLALVERLMNESLEEAGLPARQRLLQSMVKGEWADAARQLDELVPRCREARAAAEAAVIGQVAAGVGRCAAPLAGRRLEDVQRAVSGLSLDVPQLQQKLRQLVSTWALDRAHAPSEPIAGQAVASNTAQGMPDEVVHVLATEPALVQDDSAWRRLIASVAANAGQSLPASDARGAELAREITAAANKLQAQGPVPHALAEFDELCQRARKIHQHREHMLEQLSKLCHELTAGMADLSEDASWAKGQCDAMRAKLEEGLTARGVRAVSNMLKAARSRQLEMRQERETARQALREMVNRMLQELDQLGTQTGRFHDNVGRYAEVIEQADTLEGLAQVVRNLAAESREARSLIGETHERLASEHDQANRLSERVTQLESELRRLSEEVSTDQLTQIANRRGLFQAFAAEKARAERSGKPLTIGLIDIDDFKRLNDTLGHVAGDDALKALAAKMREGLRPTDTVARYGGEEFVVMLPETDVDMAVNVLTRLQRSLTRGLFMHNDQQVFVTFSAGCSTYRLGEPLEDSLDRADEALYEAKRTGKNRTCVS